MFCSKCGYQNNQGEIFCKQCGIRLESNAQQVQQQDQVIQPQQNMSNNQSDLMQQSINNQQSDNFQVSNNYSDNGSLNQNYVDNVVNPNMKKWAILSIVVPVIAFIWYFLIGLSFYIAIMLVAVGFSFAQKGEMSNKKLAIVGKILNGIFAGMVILTLLLQLIIAFTS